MTDELNRREGESMLEYARRRSDAISPTRLDGESMLQFARRRAELFGHVPAEQASVSTPAAVSWEADADLIPDITNERSPEQYEMDAILDAIDIVDAYNLWCGKMIVDAKGKTENIMVSCPFPGHDDKEPSVALTLNKGKGGVGMCYRCEEGFDKYDLAAFHFGFDVPGYKSKEDFPKLRQAMAEDLGYTVVVAGKDEWLVKAPTPTPAADLAPASATPSPSSPPPTSTDSSAEPSPTDSSEILHLVEPSTTPSFDWRTLPAITEGTFLHTWMTLASESFEPEEFYLFEGLIALGSAVGNKVTYRDAIPVRPNMMVCLVGATGTGKSISISLLEELFTKAMPFDRETAAGVRMVGSPGSGEAFIDQFCHKHTDSATGTITENPVNGLCKESELAGLMKRIGRHGNTTREVMMDLYDRPLPVSLVSRGAGEVIARDHFMQMVTSTQQGSIRRLLTDADAAAGFLNRWVFAFGTPKHRPAITTFRADVTPAVEPIQKIRAWASSGREVNWHDTALMAKWTKFHDLRIHPLTMDEDAWMVARLPLLAKKLLLLFAINDRSTTVTEKHVDSVILLWDYLMATYGIVELNVGQDDMTLTMECIEKYVADRPTEMFTIRQLHYDTAARKFGKELIIKCVQLLVQACMLQEVPRNKGDRVARYMYQPDGVPTGASLTVIAGGKSS